MRTEYSLVDSERIVDNLGNQGTVLELRKIANSLTEQCEHKIFLISGFWSDYRLSGSNPPKK